jgi:hypothetical protein
MKFVRVSTWALPWPAAVDPVGSKSRAHRARLFRMMRALKTILDQRRERFSSAAAPHLPLVGGGDSAPPSTRELGRVLIKS